MADSNSCYASGHVGEKTLYYIMLYKLLIRRGKGSCTEAKFKWSGPDKSKDFVQMRCKIHRPYHRT